MGHSVPLSTQAVEVVRQLLKKVRPAQRHLLSHRSNLGQRISENTLNGALRRMGCIDQLTGHVSGATLSTALHDIGYPKPWIDAQLSHADPDNPYSEFSAQVALQVEGKASQEKLAQSFA
ncbi:Integrase [Pseudomonas sp. R2-60-08W]|nr:Integrase [Pseudomonas sp. R2-60-08W]